MGKAIKSKIPSTHTFTKKTIAKKKVNKATKKPDIINDYFQALSTNFGSTLSKFAQKRKRERGDSDQLQDSKKTKHNDEYNDTMEGFFYRISMSAYTFTANTKFVNKICTLQSDDEVKDLFHIDESKNSNEYTFYTDWCFHICDELSLEGLEGITIEAFWLRLKHISSYPVLLEGKEHLFWEFLKHFDQIEYHLLPSDRGNLIIYDRNSFLCPETSIVLEPIINIDDIYPYCMVNKDGVKGSCSTYDERLDCTVQVKKFSLDEALKTYGNRLVMVASQQMRENSIISEVSNPNLDLVDNEYGLLERVGRSRKHGELTQGKLSILNIIKDSRSIFHIRKSLEKKKLLKKQFFVLRSFLSQNKTGKLLHLPRFYRKQKSKTLLLTEEVVELLRHKPGYTIEFGEFKKYFPRSTGVHKIIKMPEFNKYVKTDIFHPYRHFYPNASTIEWKYKNKDKERILRVFQLVDPTINVSACWDGQDNEQNSDDECVEEETPGNKIITSEFLKEVFLFIFSKGKDGVTLQELEKNIELDFYTLRIAIRKLQAKNVIDSVRSDLGKQRHILYFARCFHSKNQKPMPVSKPLQIPQAVLQKVLQPQTTANSNNSINVPNLILNGDKFLRSSEVLSISCHAFLQNFESEDQAVELATVLGFRDILWKRTAFNLTNEKMISKFFKIMTINRRKSRNFAKVSDIIPSYKMNDLAMKFVLLKLTVYGMKTSVMELLEGHANGNAESRDVDIEALFNETRGVRYKITHSFTKDYLLGPSPLVLYEETTPEKIDVTILLSTPPNQYIENISTYVTFDRNLTSHALFRINTILDLINKNLIICDIFNLQKSMMEVEFEAKASVGRGKIDKHTLNRMLLRLSSEGYIKIFKIMLSTEHKFKAQWIVAHPTIEMYHPLFKAAQENAIVKLFLGMDKGARFPRMIASEVKNVKPLQSPFDSSDVKTSFKNMREAFGTKPVRSYKYSRDFAKKIGFQPKFVRLQLLHELLYYLIYDYQVLDSMSHVDIEEVLTHYVPEQYHEIPPIHRKGIDWKMFVPPLPTHKDWGDGWALLCDIMLSIPLSIWVKLWHTSLECRELLTFMEHPVKRHYLIRDLPFEFRQVLMFRRKYIFIAVELISKLCYMGLVQLGPQSAKFKDQLFLYLNRNATLLDTTTSDPSYHKVSPKKYQQIKFNFTSKSDIDDYWCQLWTISMNTPLGQRTVMVGKSVEIENTSSKSTFLDAQKAKTSCQARDEDDGRLPGDNLGAAGLDSSMWAHIKRNWLWSTNPHKKVIEKVATVRDVKTSCIKPVSIKYKELVNQNRKIYLPSDKNQAIVVKSGVRMGDVKKSNIIHRKFSVYKKKKVSRKNVIDAKDKKLLKKLGRTFRATWSEKEEKFLLICKAASLFLTTKTVVISSNLLRDVLHIMCPESKDKSTGACLRRIAKLKKIDPISRRIRDNAGNLINLMEISKYFSPIIFGAKSSNSPYSSHEIASAYIYLMSYIQKNLKNVEMILNGRAVNMDYFVPENVNILSPLLVNVESKKSVFSNPTIEEEIQKDVLQSVLLSFLNNSKLEQHTSYQLFKICTRYPDHLLRSSVAILKNKQAIITIKKKECKDLISMPFQLSSFYMCMRKSTLTPLISHTIFQNHLEMCRESTKFLGIDPSKTGYRYCRLIARNETAAIWSDIQYSFNIPTSAYILNPYIKDRSALITELATLYHKYLKQNDEKKKTQQTNQGSHLSSGEQLLQSTETKKRLEIIKINITRLLTSLPCLCNEKIHEKFTLFVESKDEIELKNCLSIFLDSLIGIVLNLLDSDKEPTRFLNNYISKFHKTHVINSAIKELEVRIYKVGFLIRQFLKTHQLTNVKECFENESTSRDEECENILRVWLEKSKFDGSLAAEKPIETPTDHNLEYSFFKYRKTKTESEYYQRNEFGNIPSIDEIIEGMMAPPDHDFSKKFPQASELVSLLSKEKFPELNKYERFLEDLQSKFIAQYPILENFTINNVDEFKSSPIVTLLFNAKNREFVLEKVHRNFTIGDPNKAAMLAKLLEAGGNTLDVQLCEEIITCIYNKGVFGASGQELKTLFESRAVNISLLAILNNMLENFIILRTGIADIVFVHNDFYSSWLVQTFHLLPQESSIFQTSGKNLELLKQKIENRINLTNQKNIILMPWILIDGSLNIPLLEMWATSVLSYCLEFPNCPLPNIFEKFHLLKPVELYYLLEMLDDINCLKMFVEEKPVSTLFSARQENVSRPATMLDNFKNMYVVVHPFSNTCMGSYLNRDDVKFL